jgi:hypothetical protein
MPHASASSLRGTFQAGHAGSIPVIDTVIGSASLYCRELRHPRDLLWISSWYGVGGGLGDLLDEIGAAIFSLVVLAQDNDQ